MSASDFWLNMPNMDHGVDLNAGAWGASLHEVYPHVIPFARAWERACHEAARHDHAGSMGLLERYIRPLMIDALKRVDAFPHDPWTFTITSSRGYFALDDGPDEPSNIVLD